MSASSNTTDPSAMSSAPPARVLIWDLPVRLGHWLLAASFGIAYVLGEADGLRNAHALFGYTVALIVAFRLVWGLVGTRPARFSALSLSPSAVLRYLRSLATGRPEHHLGHNPAGSWAVIALLGLLALTAASGAAAYNDIGPHWLEDVHEGLAQATLAMVALHVTAVIVSSLLHRENLPRAMLSGRKAAAGATDPQLRASGPRRMVAVLLLAAVAALWAGLLPAPGVPAGTSVAAALTAPADGLRRGHAARGGHDDDDD